MNIKFSKFKGLKYKKFISLKLGNPGNISGHILILVKKRVLKHIKLILIWRMDVSNYLLNQKIGLKTCFKNLQQQNKKN